MAMNGTAYLAAQRSMQEADVSRREKMQALNEFMNQQAAAGVELTPDVVNQQIESLIGNDWYLRGSFPAGELMNTMLKKQNQAAQDAAAGQQIKRLQGAFDAQNLVARTLAAEDIDASDPMKVQQAATKMLGPSFSTYFDNGMINPGRLAVAVQGERDNIARAAITNDSYVTKIMNVEDLAPNGQARANIIAKYGTGIGKIIADRRLADLTTMYDKAGGEVVSALGKDDLLFKGYIAQGVDDDTKTTTMRERVRSEYARLGIPVTDAAIDGAVTRLKDYFTTVRKQTDTSRDIAFLDAAAKDPEITKAGLIGRFELVADRVGALAQTFGISQEDAIKRLETKRELDVAVSKKTEYATDVQTLFSKPEDMEKARETVTKRQGADLRVEATAQNMSATDIKQYAPIMAQLAEGYRISGRYTDIVTLLKSGKMDDALKQDSTAATAIVAKQLGLQPLNVREAAMAQLANKWVIAPGTEFDRHLRDVVKDRLNSVKLLEEQVKVIDPRNPNPTLWQRTAPALRTNLERQLADLERIEKELDADLNSPERRAIYGGTISSPQKRAEFQALLGREIGMLRSRLQAIQIPEGPQAPAPGAAPAQQPGGSKALFDPAVLQAMPPAERQAYIRANAAPAMAAQKAQSVQSLTDRIAAAGPNMTMQQAYQFQSDPMFGSLPMELKVQVFNKANGR